MATDTRQKRMSAIHHLCPWRGPMVDAAEAGFDVGHRQAALYIYSGIASGTVAVGTDIGLVLYARRRLLVSAATPRPLVSYATKRHLESQATS